MAMSLQERLRLEREATAKWVQDRNADVSRAAKELEARGRKVYSDTIRTGERVLARTESELRELGKAASQRRTTQASKQATHPSPVKASVPQSKPRAQLRSTGPGEQARAALSGAVDEFTFGTADHVSAGIDAILKDGFNNLPERYKIELAEEQRQDEYDAQHLGIARGTGQAVGFVASITATGPAGAAGKTALRLAAPKIAKGLVKASKAANATKRIAPMTAHGLTPMAIAGGATGGVVGQGASDVLSGQVSDLRDYAGAALGGAAGGLTARLQGNSGQLKGITDRVIRNPMVAGAVEGLVTSGAQAVLNGRDLELLDLARGARGGAIGAQVGDLAGKYGANALSTATKGRLGESLTMTKAILGGDGNPLGGKPVADFDKKLPGVTPRGQTPGGPGAQRWLALPAGRWTQPDFITNKAKALEAKFGASARRTDGQKIAAKLFGPDRYQTDHWLPSDIGKAGSVLLAAPAGDLDRER